MAAGAAVPSRALEAHHNLTEVIAALAFCGLPGAADPPQEQLGGARLTLTVRSPALLVSNEIRSAPPADDGLPLLVSQQFYRTDAPYRYEGNEHIEKFVTGEFIRRVVYGGRITLTNPTGSRRRVNVLYQIPTGAVPMRNGLATEDREIVLEPYSTERIDYFFLFPFPGEFAHFPAQIAADGKIIARADPRRFRVVPEPAESDPTSWAWISQNGAADQVLAFLRSANRRRLDLDEIARRLRDRGFFRAGLRPAGLPRPVPRHDLQLCDPPPRRRARADLARRERPGETGRPGLRVAAADHRPGRGAAL